MANIVAVVASNKLFYGKSINFSIPDDGIYETVYNKACFLIGEKQFSLSLDELNKAEERLKISLASDPDISAQDLNNELAPINVQKAYVLQKLNKLSEAQEIYHNLNRHKPEDATSLAVASNNILSLNRDQNIFDSRKRVKTAVAPAAQAKLVSQQRQTIALNEALFHLISNQADLCLNSAATLMQQNPDDLQPVLIFVSQLMRQKQFDRAIEAMQAFNSRQPGLKAALCLAQLHLQLGQITQACQALESLPAAVLCSPGVTSTLVQLYRHLEDSQSERRCLLACLDYQRGCLLASPDSVDRRLGLLHAAGSFLTRLGQAELAAGVYEEALELRPDDRLLLARLIGACSQFDSGKAAQLSQRLRVDDQFSEPEVDQLEAAFLFGTRYLKRITNRGAETPGSGAADPGQLKMMKRSEVKQRRRRRRKKVVPRGADPSVPPDPERWLPKKERSYFRRRGKDKRNFVSRGPQGKTTGGAELDVAAQPRPSPVLANQAKEAANPSNSQPAAVNSPKPSGGLANSQKSKSSAGKSGPKNSAGRKRR